MPVSLSQQQKVLFYESRDLIHWNKTGELEINRKDPEVVWECPDLVYLTSSEDSSVAKWLLIVNVNPGGYQPGSGVKYFIGSFDGYTFKADDGSRMDDFIDHGADFYAVTSFFQQQGQQQNVTKVEAIAWMSNWIYT